MNNIFISLMGEAGGPNSSGILYYMRWILIKGFEDRYILSEFGNIIRIGRKMPMPRGGYRDDKEIELTQSISKKGYPCIRLSKKNKTYCSTIHRLVASHFIPNPENKPQVNHKDCNKSNNHFSNLEWATNRENIDHAVLNGRFKNHIHGGKHLAEYSKNRVGSLNNKARKVKHLLSGTIYNSLVECAKEHNLKNYQLQHRLKKQIDFVRI